VEDLGAGRRCVELALFGLVVVVVMLPLVVNLMINVIDGIGKGIKFLLLVLLGHVGVVLLLLEAHLDRDAAPVQVRLPVQVPDRQQCALFVLVVYESPELRLLQPDCLDFSQQSKHLIQRLSGRLSRQ